MSFLISKSDQRATTPPPTPIISPNTFNQNFEIAIVFKVNERSGNYVFEGDNPPPPTAIKARAVTCVLGTFKVYIERVIL